VILCVTRPFVAFCVLVFLGLIVWLSRISLIGNFSVIVGIGLVFTFMWISRIILRKTILILLPEFWSLLGLLIAVGLSSLINFGGPAGFGGTFTYLQLILLVIIVVNFSRTPSHLHALGYIFIISSVFIALMMLLAQAGVLPEGIVRSVRAGIVFEGSHVLIDRSGGILGDPNFTALQLLVGIPFILEFWKAASGSQRVFLTVSSVMILWAFRYTYSIGGLVGLAVILFVRTFFIGKHNFYVLAVRAVLILFIGWWLTLNFLPDYYWARVFVNLDLLRSFFRTNDPKIFLQLGTTRGDAWTAAFKTFLQSPIWGHGPGNAVFYNMKNSDFTSFRPVMGAHNFLLSIANDVGIIGFSFFVTLLIQAIRTISLGGEQNNPVKNAIFIALIASLVQGLAIDIHTQKILWILIGMSLATLKNFRAREVENSYG